MTEFKFKQQLLKTSYQSNISCFQMDDDNIDEDDDLAIKNI